jgi:hypothetical protein
MTTLRALLALLLCAAAAHAQPIEPLIERPLTLTQGKLDLTLHGTYTNWTRRDLAGNGFLSPAGETLAAAADFGATDALQLGLGVAVPIHPGLGFGSLLGNVAVAVDPRIALRADLGFEKVGVNGDDGGLDNHEGRYFGGIGASIKVPITPTIAFVTPQARTVHFGHFNNLGTGGTGIYTGASELTEASSDFVVVNVGKNSAFIGFNLPAGLLLQPDRRVAVTLQAGYSAVISTVSSGRTMHFIPVGLEAVVTAVPWMDIGARFFIDGCVAQSTPPTPGYFDMRALMFWLRFHV